MRHFLSLLALVCLATSAGAADPPLAGPIAVHPAAVKLTHQRQPQSLQVLATTAEGYSLDLRPQAKFASADEKIAAVDSTGWVRPIASGQTEVIVTVLGQTLKVPVNVQLPAAEPAHSFRHEVMPALSKAGCNMGACHGYSLGKNGFRLSLRGADPEQDYLFITKEFFGRRVNFEKPEASLLVAKPRGDVPHEGGIRFKKGSLVDGILTDWVAGGAAGDLPDQNRVVAVRLVPETLVLHPGEPHPLQCLAEYSDGTVRDVTRLTVFTANNEQFARVDEEGLVAAGDAGETAIVARFERTFAATSVLVLKSNPGFVAASLPEHIIDRPVVAKLNRLKIVASPPADDEEFLRRVYLDLIGVQPKPDDVRAFLASTDASKREQTIDALLARPELIDHWSLKWGDLLQNSRNSVSSQGMYLFREFIRGAVAANMPLDEFARRILTAKGGGSDDPASAYFAIRKDTNDTVERSTQVFCGIRMLCARCHTHPLENWTQADYYGVASFFSQVSTRPDTRFSGVQNAKLVQLNLAAGPAINPRTSRGQQPKFLGGEAPTLAAEADRREAYALWLTAKENPLFARSLVNRLWSYFFHRGIIEPVDDIRSTNPPINPDLLEALTKDFAEHGFDARRLMRQIVTSETYQRASTPTESNEADEQNFSHAIPRRVPAEALLDSLVQATGVPESFGGAPAGFRAAQLPDGNVTSSFLNLFGKPQRMEACECERDNSSNMLQALHFINGASILGRVQNPGGRAATLLKQKLTDEELIAELYLWSLARRPSPKELEISLVFLKSYGDAKADAVQDMLWALLNSKDFLLVH